ncbi:hypothetical protein CORC01_09671 [Colletotrichum orchidophilum]|uniref:F-box domain-containing protein n=1 Tax=Colletotrichum orchidophilum TaxID=1209926 RepID=A0A1G4B0U2_9PEZI|nr:uncharacterized protein CORC01_09671 [Colletotrichum orchidophilum]OHE95014.1 hypothetical protein CORC01_09671 [Colletotrichum orchidophilum]
MASLLTLPLEILQQILTGLTNSLPEPASLESFVIPFDPDCTRRNLSTLARLCQTCRYLREIAEPALHRHVYIRDADVTSLVSLLKCWKARPHCARYTRRLTIKTKLKLRYEGTTSRPQSICIEDVDFVSGIIRNLGLKMRSDWFEHHWNTDVLLELAMIQAQNALCVELLFQRRTGIYRTPFDMIPEPNQTIKPIRFDNLRNLHLEPPDHNSTMDEFKHILDCAPNLQGFRLESWITPQSLVPLPPNLTTLILPRINLTAFHLNRITSNSVMLRHLELGLDCYPRELNLLTAIAKHRNTLTSLALFSHRDILIEKLETFHKLESFTTSVASVRPGEFLGTLPYSLREFRILEGDIYGSLQAQPWFDAFCTTLEARARKPPKDLVIYKGCLKKEVNSLSDFPIGTREKISWTKMDRQ